MITRQVDKTTFTLTGQGPKTRAELERMINKAGGWVQSISKNTDILVTNSIYSKSRKMLQAKKWSIPIIDYGELMIMLEGDTSLPSWEKREKVISKRVQSVDKKKLTRSIEI